MTFGDNVVFLGAEDWNMGAFQWARASATKIVCVDPIQQRRRMLERIGGADAIVDPQSDDPVEVVRATMPHGADVVFIAVEAYEQCSHAYLRQAFDLVRVQGTVVITRIYGREAYEQADPMVASAKEISVRHAGACFGEEPWRGGRARGDYALTIDGIASGRLNPPSWQPSIISYDDLRGTSDLEELFHSLPHAYAKAFVRISSTSR
jgi:threonine dehydrogenase-like Zn-dependent dehydrogenase